MSYQIGSKSVSYIEKTTIKKLVGFEGGLENTENPFAVIYFKEHLICSSVAFFSWYDPADTGSAYAKLNYSKKHVLI